MKKTILLLGLGLVLFMMGCEPEEQADNETTSQPQQTEAKENPIIGTYKSLIVCGRIGCPGITKIYYAEDGELNGEYEYTDKGAVAYGKLFDFEMLGPQKIKCKWKDKFGGGDLVVSFNEDHTEFKGYWKLDGRPNKYHWVGSRQ
jgi:hypothetical protein